MFAIELFIGLHMAIDGSSDELDFVVSRVFHACRALLAIPRLACLDVRPGEKV